MISDNILLQFLDATIRTNFGWEDFELFKDFLKLIQTSLGSNLDSNLDRKLGVIYPTFVEMDQDKNSINFQGTEGNLALMKDGYLKDFNEYISLINSNENLSRELTWKEHEQPLYCVIKVIQKERKGKELELTLHYRGRKNQKLVAPHRKWQKEKYKKGTIDFKEVDLRTSSRHRFEEIEGANSFQKMIHCHYPLLQYGDDRIYYFFSNHLIDADPSSNQSGFLKLMVLSERDLTQAQIGFFTTALRVLSYQRKFDPILKKQKLRTAIISILVDSYAHNISAHSLVAIEGWFRRRSGQLDIPIPIEASLNDIIFPNYVIDHDLLHNFSEQAEKYYQQLGLSDQKNSKNFLTLADIIRLKLNGPEKIVTLQDILHSEYSLAPGELEANSPKNEPREKLDLQIPVPVDYIIWPFIRFLKGKAAFWSGVTRDRPFGGEHISLHKILFDEFATNALYVGTISATEGVHKLNIRIGLDQNFGLHSENKIQFYDYLQINTEVFETKPKPDVGPMPEEDYAADTGFSEIDDPFRLSKGINYSEYGFIRLGKDFTALRNVLDQEIAFIPGRIVGIHSFITIIENTIRNVKHYRHCLPILQQDGLNLLLTFEKMDLFNIRLNEPIKDGQYTGVHRLYRTGVAIGHPILDDKDPYQKIIDKLSDQILDAKTDQPILGGTSQDKICSSMLLTNKFINVENVKTRLDYFYYPWTHPIRLCREDFHKANTFDTSLSETLRDDIFRRSHFTKGEKNASIRNTKSRGTNKFFFKFFNIWHSGEIVTHKLRNNLNNQESENPFDEILRGSDNSSRFKMLIVDDIKSYLKSLISRVEERNIFRVVDRKLANTGDISEIYKVWNQQILHHSASADIYDASNSGDVIQHVRYYTVTGRHTLGRERFDSSNFKLKPGAGNLIFTHAPLLAVPESLKNNIVNYRSHGVLIEQFACLKGNIQEGIKNEKILEFVETVLLDIKIWDDRIFQRVSAHSDDFTRLQQSFNLFIYNEDPESGSISKIQNDQNGHGASQEKKPLTIYVVHLSFLHELCKGNLVPEKKSVDWFIENYLADKIVYDHDNEIDTTATFYTLCLCIISGRGNAEWYKNDISDKYIPFIIYKPIESLLNAITDALEFRDDFQLKYNVCKTLIG